MVSKLKQQFGIEENTLNSLPVAVILFGNKKIYYANSKAQETFKLPKSKNAYKCSIFELFDKKEQPRIKHLINEILKGKNFPALEVQVNSNSSQTIWLKVTAGLAFLKNKKVVQAVFNHVPVSKAEYKNVETAKDLIQKINLSGNTIFYFSFLPIPGFKFISKSIRQLLGHTPSAIYNNKDILVKSILQEDRHLLPFLHLDNADNTRKKTKSIIQLRCKHKNGKTKYIEITTSPLYNDKKELEGLVGNISDVTGRQENETILKGTKEKFDLIANHGNEIIAFYSFIPEEKYHYVSPNIKKILGYLPSELTGDKDFFRKKMIQREERYEKTYKTLKNYQEKNIFKNHSYFFKTTKKNGEEVWLENNFVPVAAADGKISFFIYILRDITKQKEKEIEIERQYTNYRNLLDNSPVAYIIHDQGVCLYANKSLLSLLKIRHKKLLLGKFMLDFFKEEDRKKMVRSVRHIYATKRAAARFMNFGLRDCEDNEIDVEIKSVLIKFNNKDCILSLVNNLSDQRQRERERQKVITIEAANALLQKEIKEKQEAEKSLTEKTAHLSSIFESSTHLLWTINKDYRITSYNSNFATVVKQHHKIEVEPGCRIDHRLIDSKKIYVSFWYARYAEAFKGKKLEFEKEDNLDGKKIFRKVFINPIYDKNEITELSCIANDITDSKMYEQKLLNQTAKLTAIFDSSHHYIWTIDRDERLTSFNKNYYDLITSLYNTKPYVGLVLDRGVLANDREYTMMLKYHYDRAFSGIATNFEIETRDQKLKKIYLEIFLNPIYESEKVIEVSGIAHNITEKKQVQQRIEVSLKEKEVLLREVHHRVKNNMQVISSILNLQSSYVSDEYTLTLLKESQNRIKTMAYIHESLYQNKSFTSVNFSEYVLTLVNNIVQSYSYSADKIHLVLNIQRMSLSLDSSIPAGLIINELITNAIKHAFPGTRKGSIFFNLRCENNLVILELKDDGVGFAQGIDFENSHSLGLQLVNTLTEQIEGDIEFKSQKNIGTEVIITFKM